MSYIATSLHSRTSYYYRIPSDPDAQNIFWIANLIQLLTPLLIAARTNNAYPDFGSWNLKISFGSGGASGETKETPTTNANNDKKGN